MTSRFRFTNFALGLIAVVVAAPSTTFAQEAPKAPKWSYAFDLACRKFGEDVFGPDTKKWGVEVFKDANNGLGVYISQGGVIATADNFAAITPPLKDSKAPVWRAGLDLKSRKFGEAEFTDKTKSYGLEVFYDTNSGNWIYISENGHIAVTPGKDVKPGSLIRPEWLYSYDLKCRKGGQKNFDDPDTPKYGIEIYNDKNTGNLIYICETGAIAVISAAGAGKKEKAGPEWLHGQDMQCRKVGEAKFSKDTRKFGVEIFRDGHNDNLLFISETGSITVIPGGKELTAPSKEPKDAQFKHGLDLSARQAGEKDFTPATKTYALEVFTEPNVNATVYICQTGAIAAVQNKK